MTDPSDTATPAAPTERVKILLVDDEEPILRALQREFRGQPFDITACSDPLAALAIVEREHFALIITDNRMPGMTGIDLLQRVKLISPDTSRIVLTGYSDLESAMRAINEGEINSFISKPWDRKALLDHVNQSVEKFRLRIRTQQLTKELEQKNELLQVNNDELRKLALRDQMTGLYNHAEFQRGLERQVKLHRRDHQAFCLAMGDIDNFKRVNDTHGHPGGDAVIKSIANILQSSLRDEVDSTYRYGGEEFAVIMRNTNEDQGHLVMSRILERVARTPVAITAGSLSVTMSYGVGQFDAAWSPAEFVQRVDQALYASKHAGKNRVTRLSNLAATTK